jgi:hypothetical protein
MITLQTLAALERIQDALIGNTDDNLDTLKASLESLLNKARDIQDVSACLQSGDC